MTEGEAFIRGGSYINRFGKAYSCGIYARGGDLAISGSNTTFSAIEDGVCVRCEKTTVDSTTYVPQLNISGTPQFFSVNNETIQVEDGDIAVSSGTATVKAKNSTGIYINGGNLKVASTAALDVTAEITERSTEAIYHSPDGVVVQGGSLLVYGALDVKFTGVENTGHDKYDNLNIRSFAVRVLNAETVTILNGSITNNVGGGVYVGGGTVELGNTDGGPTIETNKTGGHAVEVNGGDLSVYNGLYKADLGNGILVRGGNARIIGGIFQGNDTQDYRSNYGGNLPAGPAAYYALKLLGGSVTTFGGTFGTYTDTTDDITTTHTAGGSSAFVTGVGDQAIANIYGGSFVVSGQAGFSVYQNVALTTFQ